MRQLNLENLFEKIEVSSYATVSTWSIVFNDVRQTEMNLKGSLQ